MVGVVRRMAAGVSHGRVRTRREQERTRTAHRRSTRVGSMPSSDRSMPTVPHAWTRPRPSGQADSLPEAGERTERKDRSGRRSWTFDREPDHGNALMIRAMQNPVRGYVVSLCKTPQSLHKYRWNGAENTQNIPPLHELTLSLHVRNIKTAIFQRFQICVLRSRVTAA